MICILNLKNTVTQSICFYSLSFFVLFGYILPKVKRSVVRWGYFYVYNHSEWRKNNWQALQFNLHSPPPYRCNNHRLHNTTTKGPYYTIYLLTWCATRTIVDYFGQQLNNSSVCSRPVATAMTSIRILTCDSLTNITFRHPPQKSRSGAWFASPFGK